MTGTRPTLVQRKHRVLHPVEHLVHIMSKQGRRVGCSVTAAAAAAPFAAAPTPHPHHTQTACAARPWRPLAIAARAAQHTQLTTQAPTHLGDGDQEGVGLLHGVRKELVEAVGAAAGVGEWSRGGAGAGKG